MSVAGKTKKSFQLLGCELRGIINSKKLAREEVDVPVDFVVTWVDDKDEKWKQEKDKYWDSNIKGNGSERYRDWDQFIYWFRAVEKYAPWVRKIHIITYGHYPKWLNLDHKKIHLVNHKDFIPQEYLPTFSINPIELNLHRIEGLSEHFVYFNDDMYLNSPVQKEDFFNGIYPKYCCEGIPYYSRTDNGLFEYMLINNIGLVNEYFDISKCIYKNPELWFNKLYKNSWKYHRRSYCDNYLYGMLYIHLAAPMRKSTIKKVWEVYGNKLDNICHNRFRSAYDVQQQLFHLWDIMSGEFNPVSAKHYGRCFFELNNQIDEIKKTILEGKELSICLNDSGDIGDQFEYIKSEISKAFEKKYTNKSSFEL